MILAVNPGSTSTKVGLYEDEKCLFKETLRHLKDQTAPDLDRETQASIRREAILSFLSGHNVGLDKLTVIVVRGGLLKPLASGIYRVDDHIYNDLIQAKRGWHASNLGSVIALPLARELNIPVYTVDPVTVDEFDQPARYSGLKGIPRLSMSHALNMKAVARRAAANIGKPYEQLNLIVVHLGSGTSVSAHREGRMIDVNNANEEGPFSLERCGTLPSLALVRFCFSGEYSMDELTRLLTSGGGLFSYLGTKDFTEIDQRIEKGDIIAKEVVEAMAYQVAKEIGAMSTVLQGFVERILITGGMANSVRLVKLIEDRVIHIAPVDVYPGEEELEALVEGALRVLRKEVKPAVY